MPRPFGTTSLDVGMSPTQSRQFTADVYIMIAVEGYAVAFFNDRNQQRLRLFDDLPKTIKFVEKHLAGEDNNG